MMVFRRKQIVILALVILIVVSGYLQYASNRTDNMTAEGKENSKLGEASYVNSDGIEQITKDNAAAKNDYFTKAKMEKASSRSLNTEALTDITLDANAAKEVKAQAYEQMMALAANSEKETKIEITLKEKGFSDALAVCGDDGSIDIFVRAQTLTAENVALISDVASRQANVPLTGITIKNIY